MPFFDHLCRRGYHEEKLLDASLSDNLRVVGGQIDAIRMVDIAPGNVLRICLALSYHLLLLAHSPWLAANLARWVPQRGNPAVDVFGLDHCQLPVYQGGAVSDAAHFRTIHEKLKPALADG